MADVNPTLCVSIFGLGYVGCTLATCLASDGHQVIVVDKDQSRAAQLAGGRLPFVDSKLENLLMRAQVNIAAECEAERAVLKSDISIVCVGTPFSVSGDGYDLSQLHAVCHEIGAALGQKEAFHTVVIKSTIAPGTTEDFVASILKNASGKTPGVDFGLVFNPEFLREGHAADDFYWPPLTVIGTYPQHAMQMRELMGQLYEWVHAPLQVVDFQTAEMLKLACNAWHALKVCFANEIGNVCQAAGADSEAVMELFVKDTRLNISPAYLRPGFAFGGSCLPKDVAALVNLAEGYDVAAPLLHAIPVSNAELIEQAELTVRALHPRTVGILGLAFKPGLSDFRDSPAMELMRRLEDDVTVIGYDPQSIMPDEHDVQAALACEVVVLATRIVGVPVVQKAVGPHQTVLDLAHVLGDAPCAARVIRLT